jgi:cell division protein FtsB
MQRGSTGRTTASWRVVVLILVLVMALAVILPSLRAYTRQRDRLIELRAAAEEARTEVAELEAELARWDDPAYIAAQARERLSYVMPGEIPYIVIDPETVTGAIPPEDEPDGPALRDGVPWYAVVWESIENPGGP